MNTVYLFIASLSSGGAEHQLTMLANMMADQYNVNIVTFSDVEDHYPIDDRIRRVRLEKKSKWRTFFSCFSYFLKLKRGCVISYGQRENLLCLLPMIFNHRVKVIASDRNTTIGKPSLTEKILCKILYRRAQFIVPNSQTQANYLCCKYPKVANKVVTITNYTDLNQYVVAPYPHNNVLRIGVFCRYEQQKNYQRFVLVVKKLVDQGLDNFVVEWYGNQARLGKPHPGYLNMKKLVKQNRLEKKILLNNSIKGVAAKMAEMDVLCLPSLFEGFSNTISEGICCGRPMLVSRVSDNPVMVRDGVNGFLFNPLDVDDMAKKFEKMLNLSREKREQMGMAGRKNAETLFNKEKFKQDYIKLIES